MMQYQELEGKKQKIQRKETNVSEMIYRVLGKTGLRVSIVGYGASPLGAEFGAIDPAEGKRAVDTAINAGINYFDVAPYYGRTLAETRLGEFLEGQRKKVVLATKCARYDTKGFDFSAKRITASIDESLKRLRTDWIDIFQVHDVEYGKNKQILDETIPAMQKLKKAGKARFIGITGYPVYNLKRLADGTEVDTLLTYCRYNLLDVKAEEVLVPLAKKQNLGLINASPLHMRALTNTGVPDWHPAPVKVVEAAAKAAQHCKSKGVDIADVAMQFVLANEAFATTLVGMSKVRHVDSNVKVVGTKADARLLAEVMDMFKPVMNVCWKEGLAENDDPGTVDKRS
jgi:L-galactose dehydrogenase